jgi:hypothetical protein
MEGLEFDGVNIAVAADGSTIVGGTPGSGPEAFYWKSDAGVVRIGVPGGDGSSAQDVSADGSTIAIRAWENDPNNPNGTALRTTAAIWTETEGFAEVGPLPDGWQSTHPWGISDNGEFLLGTGGPERGNSIPFLWSRIHGISPLPALDGVGNYREVFPLMMTADGSIVLGNYLGTPEPSVPFVWDAQHGVRDLRQVLVDDHGLGDVFFDNVRAISPDGTALVVRKAGASASEMWAIYLDRPLVAGVPEPATACLMLCAIFSVFFFRRSPTDAKSRPKVGRSRTHRRRTFRFESLEERSVLSATFGSALTIGNDFASSVATDVVTDAVGNSYVSGMFAGTVDFHPSGALAGDADVLTARGSADAYVAKYAPDNSLIWVQAFGGDAVSGELTDIARKISVDVGGAVYVAGEFVESADFGATTLTSVGDDDGFVAKLDAGGSVLWARRWGNAAEDSAQGLDIDAAGNVYALGHRLGDASDILKFSPSGAAVWSKSIVDRSMLTSADLAVNAAGNVYVAGSFDGTVDFDPSAKAKYVSSGSARAGFVLKLDTNGKFGWVSAFVGKRVGSTNGSSGAMSITLDGSGNLIVGGTFTGTVDFNPAGGTSYLSTQSGGFITKLNSSGGLVWARELEGDAPTFVRGLDVDGAGDIYATGATAAQSISTPAPASIREEPSGKVTSSS